MKKLFLGLFCGLLLVSCFHQTKFDYSNIKEDVFVDPYYGWSNTKTKHLFGTNPDLKSITLRVINRKYCDVLVSIVCKYQPEDVIFGSNTFLVKARNDKVLTILGFSRGVDETISCFVEKVK